MIKLESESKISQIEVKKTDTIKQGADQTQKNTQKQPPSTFRPEVVDAKVYKLKSAFVKNSVFITLSFIESGGQIRPIEIFINSKDLTRAPEYVVLTRLISAIFRRATNPMFILEELQGIFDPNGGSFKEGKYYHSFYAEIAETIERFFFDVGIIKKKDEDVGIIKKKNEFLDSRSKVNHTEEFSSELFNSEFRLCPECSHKSLKTENGCDSCIECGYSKCDK
tara:strand:+ start:139 stop:807 length:669 start_codon:yes stop_codon:yes gene_type:complete